MGTIRARVSDELEEKIEKIIEEVREEAVGGVEINLSTVIRYALDNYIKEYEERKKGIEVVKFNINELSNEQLIKIQKATKSIIEDENIDKVDNGIFKKQLLNVYNKSIHKEIERIAKRGE